MSSTMVCKKPTVAVRLSPKVALVRLLAAAGGDVQQLHLPKTKHPLEAVLFRRDDGSLVVILAVPSRERRGDAGDSATPDLADE